MMTTVTPMVTEPAAAMRAGADLRAARERLGLSLNDIAGTLRIRPSHLEALEEGRIALLPGNAYALAFVRTYASALGLDAEEMVRRFKAEAAAFDCQPELVFPVPMPERGLPAGALVLLGLVLAIGAYTGWYRLSGEGRLPAEAVIAVPERLAPLAEQAPLAKQIPMAQQMLANSRLQPPIRRRRLGCLTRLRRPNRPLRSPRSPRRPRPRHSFHRTLPTRRRQPDWLNRPPMRHASCCGPALIPGFW